MMTLSKALFCAVFVVLTAHQLFGQRVAVLTPDGAVQSIEFAALVSENLAEKLKVIDASIAESAYRSVSPPTPFNLTTVEGRRIGTAIGSDAFVILRSATQRRSSFNRPSYFESYAAVFCVSSRTGRLIFAKVERAESSTEKQSRKLLDDAANILAAVISDAVRKAVKTDIEDAPPPAFEEPPDEGSPAARGFRAPIPYRRLRPEYTTDAALYAVEATVDLMVYLDATGKVVRTELERWAGFGLDESVEKNVRSMNWRPAERDGKPIAMKFLVRYNFKETK